MKLNEGDLYGNVTKIKSFQYNLLIYWTIINNLSTSDCAIAFIGLQ